MIMLPDGNVVFYENFTTPVLQTATAGHEGAYGAFTNDVNQIFDDDINPPVIFNWWAQQDFACTAAMDPEYVPPGDFLNNTIVLSQGCVNTPDGLCLMIFAEAGGAPAAEPERPR
jgi:hypothetical protein